MYLKRKEYFARGDIYQKMEYFSNCNHLMTGANKKVTHTKPSLQLKAVGLLSVYDFLVDFTCGLNRIFRREKYSLLIFPLDWHYGKSNVSAKCSDTWNENN